MNNADVYIKKEVIIEILENMIFGLQAFERFTKDERMAINYALNIIKESENNEK